MAIGSEGCGPGVQDGPCSQAILVAARTANARFSKHFQKTACLGFLMIKVTGQKKSLKFGNHMWLSL